MQLRLWRNVKTAFSPQEADEFATSGPHLPDKIEELKDQLGLFKTLLGVVGGVCCVQTYRADCRRSETAPERIPVTDDIVSLGTQGADTSQYLPKDPPVSEV